MAEIHGPSDQQRWSRIRASDAERNQVVELLQQHFVDGRLTSDDLTERIDFVHHSTTRGELQRVLDDLPALSVPAGPPAPTAATATGDQERQGRPFWRIALMVLAGLVAVGFVGEIFEEMTPVLVIAVVFWLVARNRRQKSC